MKYIFYGTHFSKMLFTSYHPLLTPSSKISSNPGASEDRPFDFWKDVVVARGEVVLQWVGKIRIMLMADSCLSIHDTIIFCPWITLSNNRNTWKIVLVGYFARKEAGNLLAAGIKIELCDKPRILVCLPNLHLIDFTQKSFYSSM